MSAAGMFISCRHDDNDDTMTSHMKYLGSEV